MELAELLEEIEAVCGIDTSVGLIDKICIVLGIGQKERQNPFFIEKKGFVIRAASREEFQEYMGRISDLEKVEELARRLGEETEYRVDISGILRQIDKMTNDIRKKALPKFEEGEDNADKLGKYVGKKILEKHIHKISTSLFNGMRVKNGRQAVLEEIISGINGYLEQLGVYTVIAQVGEPYKDAEEFYSMVNRLEEPNPNPVIERVDCPAYVVDYLDEDGEVYHCCADGACIGK